MLAKRSKKQTYAVTLSTEDESIGDSVRKQTNALHKFALLQRSYEEQG
jgi:hypothetical protein